MKKIIILLLLGISTFIISCGESYPDQDKVGGVVKDKFKEKESAGVDIYAEGNEKEWTLEIDFEKNFSFVHSAQGINVNVPFSEIGEDIRGDRGAVYTYNGGSQVMEVNIVYDQCGEDKRSFHTVIQNNPHIEENVVLFRGCGYNLNKK